jgi:hypothetical protein
MRSSFRIPLFSGPRAVALAFAFTDLKLGRRSPRRLSKSHTKGLAAPVIWTNESKYRIPVQSCQASTPSCSSWSTFLFCREISLGRSKIADSLTKPEIEFRAVDRLSGHWAVLDRAVRPLWRRFAGAPARKNKRVVDISRLSRLGEGFTSLEVSQRSGSAGA